MKEKDVVALINDWKAPSFKARLVAQGFQVSEHPAPIPGLVALIVKTDEPERVAKLLDEVDAAVTIGAAIYARNTGTQEQSPDKLDLGMQIAQAMADRDAALAIVASFVKLHDSRVAIVRDFDAVDDSASLFALVERFTAHSAEYERTIKAARTATKLSPLASMPTTGGVQ